MYQLESYNLPPTLAEIVNQERELGIQQGFEKGIKEERKRIARELVQNDIDIELVTRLTQLTAYEIGVVQGEINAIKSIAFEMLQQGLDINLISEFTKLSIEDIGTLGNESTEK